MDAGHLHGLAARVAHHRPPGTSPSRRQLHITDHDGWRITVFATNTVGGRIADLEVRHRLRARAEDRIRGLKDTGMTNLPLQAFAKNQVWLELACLAYELLTCTQLLAWHEQPARTWEPKRLRLPAGHDATRPHPQHGHERPRSRPQPVRVAAGRRPPPGVLENPK